MKKLLTISLVAALMFVLAGCDLLSTIQAIKGFAQDYPVYSQRYTDATQFTVSAVTDLTVTDTNIPEMTSVHSEVYYMIDKNSPFLYAEETLDDVSSTSVYESAGSLYIQYVIEDQIVTPTIPISESTTQSDSNIFNMDDFSVTDVQNENLIGDHSYQFDIYLSQVIDLEKLSGFADKLKLFDEDLSSFDNALANVILTFTDYESVMDIQVSLTDYTITFEDDSYLTVSLTNHTIMTIPTEFVMPDVFGSDYQMVAVDNIELARKVYHANEVIVYPVTAEQNGWIQLYLEAGTYDLMSNQWGLFSSSSVYDSTQTLIPYNSVGMIQFTAPTEGTYYFYLVPTTDCTLDLSFEPVI
ncbi:MAG: hypothetical protein KKE16_04320 [Firmicutes bacterium]|nr:hypothetical protein [Bacillota bacterium]